MASERGVVRPEGTRVISLTDSQLERIMPRTSLGTRSSHLPYLNLAMPEFEINTVARVSMFLAHLAHESGELRWMQEIASGSAYDNRSDLGNTKPEAIRIAKAHNTTTGRFFKGHGPIQVTGYDNHVEMARELGIDCVNDPLLLTRPQYGFRAAGVFWSRRGLNEIADRGEFRRGTKKVNGGVNGLDERVEYWFRALRVLGVDP